MTNILLLAHILNLFQQVVINLSVNFSNSKPWLLPYRFNVHATIFMTSEINYTTLFP